MPVAGGSSRKATARSALPPEIRGHRYIQLCRDLAVGDKRDTDLRRAYDLTPAQIQQFALDNADQIAEIAQAISKATDVAIAGLWVSKKQNRIAELEADINLINVSISDCMEDNGKVPFPIAFSKEFQNVIRTKQTLLRSVADEIDGPRRAVVTPEDERKIVRYIVEGDDIGENLT